MTCDQCHQTPADGTYATRNGRRLCVACATAAPSREYATLLRFIARVRVLEADHAPDGWPGVQMVDLTAVARAIESLINEPRQHAKAALLNAHRALSNQLALIDRHINEVDN